MIMIDDIRLIDHHSYIQSKRMINYVISERGLKYFWKPEIWTNYFVTLTWLIHRKYCNALHETFLKQIEWCSFISIRGIKLRIDLLSFIWESLHWNFWMMCLPQICIPLSRAKPSTDRWMAANMSHCSSHYGQ